MLEKINKALSPHEERLNRLMGQMW
jgi:hypothetical protein